MRIDAEVGGKAVWAQKDDPRVTRVGRIIRKLRIDELPQAWTVLKGEMSFVGPRPERPQFVADLEARLPYYAERHVVKPGITGWAQINYPYGASIEDAREKLEFDLYYAKNYTPFLDLLILLQTRAGDPLAGGRAMIALRRPVEPFARRRALRRARGLPAAPLERRSAQPAAGHRLRGDVGVDDLPRAARPLQPARPARRERRATSPSSPSCTG